MEIYTTGAYLEPKLIEGKYMWIVTRFEEPSFKDGREVLTFEWADLERDLIGKEQEEETEDEN